MADFYVYYTLARQQEPALLALVPPMQARLAAEHGITTQLKRRPEASDGLHTWMEVYAAAPDNFAELLSDAVERAGFADLHSGQRHTEIFMDVTPCA